MTRRRRNLVLLLLVAGVALAAVSALVLARGVPAGDASAGDLLLRAARSQMEATEKLLEAVDDINRRLTLVEKMVLRDEGNAALTAEATGAASAAARLAREVDGLRQAQVLERAELHAALARQASLTRWLGLLVGGVGLLALSALARPRAEGPAAAPGPREPVRPDRAREEVAG